MVRPAAVTNKRNYVKNPLLPAITADKQRELVNEVNSKFPEADNKRRFLTQMAANLLQEYHHSATEDVTIWAQFKHGMGAKLARSECQIFYLNEAPANKITYEWYSRLIVFRSGKHREQAVRIGNHNNNKKRNE